MLPPSPAPKNLYETFLEGAKEGLQTVIDILPTLIGLIMAVEVVRAGGLLDIMTDILRPAAEKIAYSERYARIFTVTSCKEDMFTVRNIHIAPVARPLSRFSFCSSTQHEQGRADIDLMERGDGNAEWDLGIFCNRRNHNGRI